jgi:HD-GYP domain-containing protein (c-di-GMP phosphodiesterase class II)
MEGFIGRKLEENIITSSDLLLIPAGVLLTESHVQRLKQFRIDINSLKLSDPSVESSITTSSSPIEEITEQLSEIHNFVHKHGKVPLDEIENNIVPEIQKTTETTNLFKLFSVLKSSGDYRYKHSIGVSVISTLLGKWLKLNSEDLHLLTTASSLYDIGSAMLPAQLFDKKGQLHPNEYEMVKTHTRLGFNILQSTKGLHPRISTIALQHHERIDGSGYPDRLEGDQIDPLAKIVAIADIYLAMISKRPYREAHPFFKVISYLHSESYRKLDSRIVQTFLSRLMDAQIGKEAVLNDGRRGSILLNNPNYPAQPILRLENDVIDFSKNSELYITEIIG